MIFFRRRLSNNKGYGMVLIVSIIGCLSLACITVFVATVRTSNLSIANSVYREAGRSILSEYDKKLLKDYGLFVFKGDEKKIEDKIKNYARPSFQEGKEAFLRINPKQEVVRLDGYSILDHKLFKEQILANEKSIKQLLSKFIDKEKNGSNKNDRKETEGRVLRNENVINELPSGAIKSDMNLFEKMGQSISSKIEAIKNIKNFFSDSLDNSIVDSYMFSHFNSAVYKIETEERFFNNELEYILNGDMSDKKNYDDVFSRIKWIRVALNTIHLQTNSEKRSLIKGLAAAGAIVGPEGEVLAEAAITVAWAMAEANNDVKLLKEGKNVAFIKNKTQFAITDPVKALEGAFDDKTVYPQSTSGQKYFDYLRILLIFEDESEKISRMMDLIQINMKNNYNENFLLREHFVGFNLNVSVDGQKIEYEQKY